MNEYHITHSITMRKNRFMLLMAFAASLVANGCAHNAAVQSADETTADPKNPKVVPMTADDFARHIAPQDVQLVDVRTPQEYAEGHIKGAVNIDVRSREFLGNIQRLDKTRPVAVYCRSGVRSAAAAQQLLGQGFSVADLQGGIMAWQRAGKGVVTE